VLFILLIALFDIFNKVFEVILAFIFNMLLIYNPF